jgi:hypothetical protein
MKLAGDRTNPARTGDDASLEELRAEMMKHLGILIEDRSGGTAGAKPRHSESTDRLVMCTVLCELCQLVPRSAISKSNSATVDQC